MTSFTCNKGMTLIELMIVVAVVGILAAVAYPSYQEHIRKARRADAQTALMELAQFMERYYTSNGTYVGAALPFTEAPKDGGAKFYDLEFSAGPAASTYTLRASPKSADACENLTLTHTGAKGAAKADCWRR